MTRIEKMSVSVTTELAENVREAVRSGDFASSSDAVRDALRLWSDKRRNRTLAIERLRQLWDEGLASGEPQPARSAEEIIKAGQARLAKLRDA